MNEYIEFILTYKLVIVKIHKYFKINYYYVYFLLYF